MIRGIFTKEMKCGGCNGMTKKLYSQDIPAFRKNHSKWLCATCFLDYLVDGKRELTN